MRKRLFGTKRRKLIVAVIAALMLAGSAFAAWVISVNGSAGTGGIATVQNPTVSQVGSAPASDCFPGNACNLHVVVSNPNAYAMILTAAAQNTTTPIISDTFGGAQSTQCPSSNVTSNAVSGLNISITANASSQPVTIPGAYTLSSSAPVQCQGRFVSFSGGTSYTFSTP